MMEINRRKRRFGPDPPKGEQSLVQPMTENLSDDPRKQYRNSAFPIKASYQAFIQILLKLKLVKSGK